MELKPGYKRTEVGVIPKDWEVGGLGRFWGVTDCKHITAEFVENGIPVVSIKEVQRRYVDLTNAKQTTELYYSQLIEGGRKPQPGDLILSRNATVGEVAQVTESHPPFAMGQDVCLLRKKSSGHSTEYLQAVFQSPIIADQIANLMVGSTFKRINVEQIRNLSVPMPRSTEQRAIAAVVVEVDALIGALDHLISKKRDLKQAAMQQLLTGKQRLPGFDGKLEVKKVRAFGEVITGGTPSTQINEYWGGSIPWVTPTDISSAKDIFETERQITTKGLESIRALPQDSVLVTCIASIGKNAILRRNGASNQQINAIVPNDANDAEFLYYLFDSGKRYLMGNAGTTATSIISKRDFCELQFLVPQLEEQTAIAAVLSDMDAELASLEQRRDKTRALKQGMMQELLTGRIRLV